MGLCGKLRNWKHFKCCHCVEGCIDSNQHQHMPHTLEQCERIGTEVDVVSRMLFQQDNDPSHCSKSINFTKAIVERQRFRVLEWSSQPPDINIIQN